MLKSLKYYAAATVLAALLPAANSYAAASGSKIILLTVSEECSYCSIHQTAFKQEAAKLGLDVEVKITNFDPAEQASQVDQAIGQKPDAIVLWPADASAIVPSLRKIKNAGIPLVLTNSMPDQKYEKYWDVFTGPNDIGNGESAAKAMEQGFKERGIDGGDVFVIVGQPGTPPQIQRLDGFSKTLETDKSAIKIAGSQPGNWDQTKATEAASSLFTQYGDKIKGVYAQADNMLAGVIVAAQRANIDPSKLVLVGSNCSIEGVTAIEAGTQYASVLQSPIDDGQYAAKAVADLLDGKTGEKTRFLPHEVVTKANVEDCYAAAGKK
ncbi:sugar ABC transporter substrate-binding protein [Rhizobium leguminosarum]